MANWKFSKAIMALKLDKGPGAEFLLKKMVEQKLVMPKCIEVAILSKEEEEGGKVLKGVIVKLAIGEYRGDGCSEEKCEMSGRFRPGLKSNAEKGVLVFPGDFLCANHAMQKVFNYLETAAADQEHCILDDESIKCLCGREECTTVLKL